MYVQASFVLNMCFQEWHVLIVVTIVTGTTMIATMGKDQWMNWVEL